jgi:acyl carrier protein
MSDVANKIIEIIAKEMKTEPSKITLESSLEDLKIESLDVVQIVFAIEETYDITIPNNDKEYELKTVGDIVRGVERLIAQKGGAKAAPGPAA